LASIAEETFMQFRERARLDVGRVPVEGTIETTFRCNLKCAHCYVNEPVGRAEVRDRELSTERLIALIDEIADAGTLFVLFTGGEVLVRPDFPEVYKHALRRGLVVTVFTNGTLVTDRIADLFAEYRPETIEISLYGMTPATYERVTGVPGSYDKCIAGLKRLVDRGVPVRLKTMALSWNEHEVEAMNAYATELGLAFRFDSLLNPRVDCGSNRNGELQLDAKRAVDIELRDPARLAELKEFCEKFTQVDAARDTEYVYTCGAGQSSFTVDPYGQMLLCQLSRRNGYDIKSGGFAAGWGEHFPKLRSRKWQSNDVCRRCNLMSVCGSCPGAAEMETGSIEGIIPQFCEIAHLKAWAAMGERSGHREDATCCLGTGQLASRPAAEVAAVLAQGCGGACGTGESQGLIRLERRPAPNR
jgi:radical SAM protein with 4Fe4S-binding SPASM domain